MSRLSLRRPVCAVSVGLAFTVIALEPATPAHADNKRLNDGVVANVYTVQRQAGCTSELRIDPRLRQAAQWHTQDVLDNRDLNGDEGSDGSGPQDRANAAGYRGSVAETVAINPALAISGMSCFALSVLGTPVKGWDPLVVSLFGLVPAPVSEGGGSLSGSWWSARCAASTNDLEADEDPPPTVGRRNGGKDVVVQVICCLP